MRGLEVQNGIDGDDVVRTMMMMMMMMSGA